MAYSPRHGPAHHRKLKERVDAEHREYQRALAQAVEQLRRAEAEADAAWKAEMAAAKAVKEKYKKLQMPKYKDLN